MSHHEPEVAMVLAAALVVFRGGFCKRKRLATLMLLLFAVMG